MISSSKFYSIVGAMKRQGFLREHVVNLGGSGGSATFYEITAEGCRAINAEPRPHITRGGNFATDVYVMKLAERFREILRNCRISIEKELHGKFVDLVAEFTKSEPFTIGFELELSDTNLEHNLRTGVQVVDLLVEVCGTRELELKAMGIMQALPELERGKAAACLVTKLLKCERLSEVVDSELIRAKGL